MLGTAYGMAAARYELFPFALAQSAWRLASGAPDTGVSGAGAGASLLESELVSFDRESFLLSEPTRYDRRGGGAIAYVDSSVLGVDKWGEFFVWTRADGLRSLGRKLETGVEPLKEKQLSASLGEGEAEFVVERRRGLSADDPAAWNLRSFRVTDLHVEPAGADGTGARLFVAYSYWNEARQCKTLRVATHTAQSGQSATDAVRTMLVSDWRPIYETQPCIPFSYTYNSAFQSTNTGGRLLLLDPSTLLLTVGDHHLDGFNNPEAVSQDSTSDYGKVLAIDPSTGARSIFAMGVRNPQGLFRDASGKVWETEHGPEGGDELNLLSRGTNYGWPLSTFGSQYNADGWPLNVTPGWHDRFTPPVFSWVPSIAPSNLVRIVDQPTRWSGDLIVSSLRASSLFRVRLLDERVAHVEQIRIGERIRDFVQLPSGELALWLDSRRLMILREARSEAGTDRRFPVAFTASERESGLPEVLGVCASCHSFQPGQSSVAAPALYSVVGRDVASTAFAGYSQALSTLGGSWTPQRLRDFLQSPERIAPGTNMASQDLQDAELANRVVQYIARLTP